MKIELIQVEKKQKSVLRQLVELYSYDVSEYEKSDVNEYGFYGYTNGKFTIQHIKAAERRVIISLF